MPRRKLPEHLKAHNWTIKVYNWEKEDIKEYINSLRGKAMKKDKKLTEISDEMKKKYQETFDYEPTDKEVESHYDENFNKWFESDEW